MAKDLEISLRIRADLERARQSISKLEQSLDKTGSTAERGARRFNSASGSLDKMRRDASQLPALLSRIATLLGLAFSTREIARATEAYTTITNRLALVTEGSEELAAAQDAVFRIAQEARAPLTATAELYQRIATNADSLGLSAAGLEDIVSTVNKTLAISGTSGAGAEAALVQLGQAFASGTLRGEELNSVLEQAPALAQAIAEGLDVTVGQLRALGAEGRLTSESLITALQKSAGAVDERFSRIQVTGGQALTVLGNSITRVIGELDVATGSSQAFASALGDLTAWLDSGALTEGAIETLEIWGNTFDLLSEDFNRLAEAAGLSFDDIETSGDGLNQFLIKAFRELPANIRAAIQLAATEIIVLFDRITANAVLLSATIKSAFTDDTIEQAFNAWKTRQAQISQLRKDSIASILEERDATLEVDEAERKRRENERKSREEARNARAAEIAALREQARDRTIDLTANDPEAEKKRLKQLEDDAKKVAELRVRLLQAQGKEQEAIQVEFETRYGDLLKRLEERGDEAGQAIINNLLDLEQLRARFKTAQDEIDRVLQNQQQQETSINAQREAGLITEAEARRRIVELHRETYAELEKQRPLLEELAQQPGEVGQAAGAALAQLNAQSEQLRYTLDLFQATLRNTVESGLTEALFGLTKGTLTFRDAIRDLGTAVLDAMIRIQAQELAQTLTKSAFGSGGGSGDNGWVGTAANAIGSYFGFNDGGSVNVAGAPTTHDSIPAMLTNKEFVVRNQVTRQPSAESFLHDFNARGMAALADWAPAYHNTGGLAGVPAPAMPSPTMGNAKLAEPAAAFSANLTNSQNFYLVDDPQRIGDIINSDLGKNSMIVQISRDPQKFKQAMKLG
jgi:tape measure domain